MRRLSSTGVLFAGGACAQIGERNWLASSDTSHSAPLSPGSQVRLPLLLGRPQRFALLQPSESADGVLPVAEFAHNSANSSEREERPVAVSV